MKKALIVSHDAGGAQILRAWARKNKKKFEILFCLKGPALKVFQIGQTQDLSEAFSKLRTADFVLTGSSGLAGLERRAIKLAKEKGVKVVSFLDHWENQKCRFPKGQLPDEIWLGDRFAFTLAKKNFPEKILRLVPNPYFQELKKIAKNFKNKKTGKKKILFISEQICDAWEKKHGKRGEWQFDETRQLNQLLSALKGQGSKISKFVIRLHPAEKRTKYNQLLKKKEFGFKVVKSGNKELLDDLRNSDLVIGAESMALVAALMVGKQVFSFLPKRIKIGLPFEGIKRIYKPEELTKYL